MVVVEEIKIIVVIVVIVEHCLGQVECWRVWSAMPSGAARRKVLWCLNDNLADQLAD